MRNPTKAAALVLAAVCGLALACDDGAITETTANVPDPSLKKGGGGTVEVEFLATLSLFGDAAGDYVASKQSVKGTNGRKRITVSGGYTLTIQYTGADISACEDGGARLTQVMGPRQGDLEITVNKRIFQNGESSTGVVVNFTTIGDDESEYWLTTGEGLNRLSEQAALTRVAKQGGFLRIVRNGESQGAWCQGIVDFEFTVSK